MARKARQRISYVLPLANSSGGHRLGVNGLAVDPGSSILYSGGRDGVIGAWDLNLNLEHAQSPQAEGVKKAPPPQTTLRQQVQAHTHWVNDIALVQSNSALVSASSDLTVKVWRPAAQDRTPPQTVGLHSDYVKVLAVPDSHESWVASSGLDRKICLWDLNGAGQQLSIEVAEAEGGIGTNKEKGSVYALDATLGIIASGGPESIVRVWDPKSGKRITKFVGHTDNIRDILISRDGEIIMSASSDQTVKLWSVTAGRCMHTLTMHDSSVWSLWSDDPHLSVFYSSDKSGLIAKTDTRDCADIDEGLSVALCQESEGVHKLACAGDYIWTATSRPSINRWSNFDLTNTEPEGAEKRAHRMSASTARSRLTSVSYQQQTTSPPRLNKKQLALKHILRLSNTAFYPFSDGDLATDRSTRRGTVQLLDVDHQSVQPINAGPEFSIEGQNGLIKHHMLSDRRRVLTLDTAGEVVMWDLMKCVPIKSFGKRHIEDVQPEVSAMESVPNWCSIDTRTGSLAITLEENACFDAELYADELEEYNDIEFKDDQRINLGKWVLRYLFEGIIFEEIKRDQECRTKMLAAHTQQRLERANAPTEIRLPPSQGDGWQSQDSSSVNATPKPHDFNGRNPTTPGLAISLATPGHFTNNASVVTRELGSPILEENQTNGELGRHSEDYFSNNGLSPNPNAVSPNPNAASPNLGMKEPTTPSLPAEDGKIPGDDSKDVPADAKETPSKFGKKFRMNMSFSMKKLARTTTAEKEKVAKKEEKEDAESDTQSEKTSDSRNIDDNFFGSVQKIRLEYKDKIQAHSQQQFAQDAAGGVLGQPKELELETLITPSLPAETPVLKPPRNTTIIIQEDRPEAGGIVDLYEGTVGSLAGHVDQIEKVAPMWLGDVLLRNTLPLKDVVKISFVLDPWQGQLPQVASDGNNRLNANRMLRARKILAYIAERIEPAPENEDEAALQPEEYLELWCNNQCIPPKMTLATIRAHIWRGGGDVSMYYKSNGRKQIGHRRVEEQQPQQPESGERPAP
ncbi:WD40 repeat-like protein [Myriangium duriaei CBS 260.36]|uniref:WD40 repeat-like protein n=1 Tax=Myriangium duriaei CBS 260.36 TaxID=1168546 RepID=A0A9P4J9N4_9PEZI|nr:WD40 repeat-like protein [Myriangium duriaei CBS 260.36]